MFDCSKCLDKCHAQCCGICPIEEDTYYDNESKIVREIIKLINSEGVDPNTKEVVYLITPITKDGTCCFLQEDLKCAIYEERSIVCKMFGDESHPLLTCPFQDKDGRIRSRQEKRCLGRSQSKIIKKRMKK